MSEEVKKLKTALDNLHAEYSEVSKHQRAEIDRLKVRVAELEKALDKANAIL